MSSQTSLLGIPGPVRAVVVGGRGGIGGAFVDAILGADPRSAVVATSRSPAWVAAGSGTPRCGRHTLDVTREEDVAKLAERLSEDGWAPNVVVNTAGVLHDGELQPERTWRRLDPAALHQSFAINAVGPALLIKHLLPLMPRGERAVFASLSARIGSIGDNRLGGWYSYRASKAAHNMLLKTASVEAKRRWPQLIIASLHPGTVATDLSAPFRSSVPEGKLFTPEHSVRQLCAVLAGLSTDDSGSHFAYDGSRIEW